MVLLGDGHGKLGKPGPGTQLIAALVKNGPMGNGFGFTNITGDELLDIMIQDPQGTEDAPILRLYVSTGPTTFMPVEPLQTLGFELADLDRDGKLDIVSTLRGRLTAQLSRGEGRFEARDLTVSMGLPQVRSYTVEPGRADAPAMLHVMYGLTDCPACNGSCSGRCVFDRCLTCLSDADCSTGQCLGQACVP